LSLQICNIAVLEPSEKKKIILDKKAAMLKAEHYCAYQERAQQEVRNKLYEWGLRSDEVEEVISELILTNFLNEERFAMAYVSGKFKIKKWGKIKIKQGLKLKKIPERMIREALNTIDFEEYLETIRATAEKKIRLITEKNGLKKKYKLISFLQSKGFENDLIFDVLKDNNLS
jgi:regulatory protein